MTHCREDTWLARKVIVLGWVILLMLPLSVSAAGLNRTETVRAPLLAYYYIWFEDQSWDRAKTDWPVLGRYSSDDRGIMREHIRLAKQSGIDGFIVSWKSTKTLNRRLEQLIDVANEENFKLAIIYQGLDFYRNPLPIERITADLNVFMNDYASSPVFSLWDRPLVIWSGTWKFSHDDIATVTSATRPGLLILGTERDVKGYQRIAEAVDGNAYYWSSVNPETYPKYPEKLAGMSNEVHAKKGIWIAPAAPGFDARLIGGKRVVERRGGATLRTEFAAAAQSKPDAIGLISWNEFSENSHIEPSVNHGTESLDVIADIQQVDLASASDFDSSEPGATMFSTLRVAAPFALIGFMIVSVVMIVRRNYLMREYRLHASE